MHFCTKYNNSQSRLLIRQETLSKVHMHRLHKGHYLCTACIRATIWGMTHGSVFCICLNKFSANEKRHSISNIFCHLLKTCLFTEGKKQEHLVILPIQTIGLLRTKVAYLWNYILNWVRTNFPYKLLWTIMDTLWTVVITQPLSIVVGKHFTVTIIKLPNVISRILIIHILPIYFCTSSWYVRAAICLEGRLSLLALSSVYSLTVEDGSWSTPMVPAQLSVPL